MKQFLRCGLAFAWTSVLGSSIAMDSLFGIPERRTVKANLGALKKGYVNIAVHGHSPLLVSEILKQWRSPEFINLAKQKGALGIQFYGICCSGLSAMYRYGGVIPPSNATGVELVLGTGAIDGFTSRRGVPVFIPRYEVEAEVGFSSEYAISHFGSIEVIADALRDGKMAGITGSSSGLAYG